MLTYDRSEVQRVVPAPYVNPDELIAAAAAAELRSEDPLGRAIIGYAQATAPSRTRSRNSHASERIRPPHIQRLLRHLICSA
jgi:cation transport ATPase